MAGLQSAQSGDIQSPKAPGGQEYGVAGDQLKGQAIVPVAGSPSAAPSTGQPAPAQPPGSGVPLSAETMYPGEPIQAGLSSGPGAGPEALKFLNPEPFEMGELRQAYATVGGEVLRRLIEWAEAQQ